MPHNFIRIDPYSSTPGSDLEKPKPERRKPKDVKAACENHGGEFECLLFDSDTQPQFAYVLFKDGEVRAVLSQLGGGEIVGQYFDYDELKPITP